VGLSRFAIVPLLESKKKKGSQAAFDTNNGSMGYHESGCQCQILRVIWKLVLVINTVIMNMCSKKEVSVPATLPDGRPRYSGCR
jgi:hypothetical protein